MTKVSEHFSRHEFACKDGCGFDDVNGELLNVLEDVRNHFSARVTITSGNRCRKHNKRVGGSKRSKHTLGIAADIKVESVNADKVYEYLDSKYPDKYGIGRYKTWTHIDVRSSKARW